MSHSPAMIRCDRQGTGLIFDLRRGCAELVHVGSSLPLTEDLPQLSFALRRERHASQPDEPQARSIIPHAGWGYAGSPAVVLHRGGAPLTMRLVLNKAVRSEHGVQFIHADDAMGVRIETSWQIAGSGLVQCDVSMSNTGSKPVGLIELASLALPLPGWASHVSRYSGRWAAEMHRQRLPIGQCEMGGASYGGRPGFGGANWVRIESADAGEHHGHGIAAHLAWSGDHRLRVECNADGQAMLLMGARLEPGEITLTPGAGWAAPRALFAASDNGISPSRQAFHRHALAETIPQAAVTASRKVHLNSWEALGFDMDLASLLTLADGAAELGIERFVLDDGWFKGRRNDTTSLGDWIADPDLFPHGLTPLIDHIHRLGMDFGLWVEPEMISPDSDLYRANPDWCLHLPGQPRPTQRNQLVLDLTRRDVTEYLFGRLAALLGGNAIAYLKWDHNRDLFPLAGKGHDQVKALYALLDRLRAAFPAVEIETCASGGGRVDFEILKRCARFWASDNNDAIERLEINAGWFDFLPLRVTGNHVGPSPNPITRRHLSMGFRAKVAMFGHMGVEADPSAMSETDRAILAAHIALYKEWRDVLHGGELIKLSIDEPGVLGWFAWSGTRGLGLIAQTLQGRHYQIAPIRLPGLDPEQHYRVDLIHSLANEPQPIGYSFPSVSSKILSGQSLAIAGLALPMSRPETAWLVSVEVE